jgi:hypothetical protein
LIAAVSVLTGTALAVMVNVATGRSDLTILSVFAGTILMAIGAQALISHLERHDATEPDEATPPRSQPAGSDRDQRMDLVWREYAARRVNRLQAAGVPANRVGAVTAWMDALDDPVVTVPYGQVRVLAAPMGAGKTEQASRWFAQGWHEARDDLEVGVPVWLDARAVVPDLHATVAAQLGGVEWLDHRCRVVVDNLDGVGFGRGRELLEEARQLVLVWPKLAVLVTSQPDLLVAQDERIDVSAWPPTRGRQAVELVADAEIPHALLVAETVDVLRSPLLALAVAARLATGRAPSVSRWELLSDLAQTTLATRRPGQSPVTLWPELARLARMILDGPGTVPAAQFGSDPQVWQLTDSGLVTLTDGHLAFALPLFEQYFGAQAIKDGTAAVEAVASAETFPRWRYAIAFTIATSAAEESDVLMRRLALTNPAAASWVLDEVCDSDPHQGGADARQEQPAAPARNPGQGTAVNQAVAFAVWLRDGQQALVDGLAPLGCQLARCGDDGQLVQWGAWLGDGHLTMAEAYRGGDPGVVELDDPHPQIGLSTGWAEWHGYDRPAGRYGRWRWARQRLREPLLRRTRRRTLDVPADCPLARERMWFLAQLITLGHEDRGHRPLDVAPLRDKVRDMFDGSRDAASSTWQFGGHDVNKADVEWLHPRLQAVTDAHLQRPAPTPDQLGSGRWAWQAYSPPRTLALATQLLRDAVTGYRHLVQTNFPAFGPALARYAVLPARVVGVLEVFDNDADAEQSGVTYSLQHDPHATGDDPPSVDLILVTEPGTLDPTDLWTSRNAGPDARRTAFVRGLTSSMPLELYGPRPATNLAYKWLAEDLYALGWLPSDLRFFD